MTYSQTHSCLTTQAKCRQKMLARSVCQLACRRTHTEPWLCLDLMVEQLQEWSGAHAGRLQGQLRASHSARGWRFSPGSTRAGKPGEGSGRLTTEVKIRSNGDSTNGLMDLCGMGKELTTLVIGTVGFALFMTEISYSSTYWNRKLKFTTHMWHCWSEADGMGEGYYYSRAFNWTKIYKLSFQYFVAE